MCRHLWQPKTNYGYVWYDCTKCDERKADRPEPDPELYSVREIYERRLAEWRTVKNEELV